MDEQGLLLNGFVECDMVSLSVEDSGNLTSHTFSAMENIRRVYEMSFWVLT